MSVATERREKLLAFVALRDSESPDPRALKRLRDELVVLNRPLAIRLARRYGVGTEDEDTIQAGTIGLMTALDKYEPGKSSFSTYAAYWIRHEIQQANQTATSVKRTRQTKIPAAVARAANQHRLKFGEEPTPADLGVSQEEWDDWTMAPFFVGISDDETKEAGEVFEVQVLGTADRDGSNPISLSEQVREALKGLSPRSKEMFVRYWLSEGEITHEELGREFKVCKRWVRYILEAAEAHVRREIGAAK